MALFGRTCSLSLRYLAISSLLAVLSSKIFLCRARVSMQNVDVAEREANSRAFEYKRTTYETHARGQGQTKKERTITKQKEKREGKRGKVDQDTRHVHPDVTGLNQIYDKAVERNDRQARHRH